jgi:hypothetical protein
MQKSGAWREMGDDEKVRKSGCIAFVA